MKISTPVKEDQILSEVEVKIEGEYERYTEDGRGSIGRYKETFTIINTDDYEGDVRRNQLDSRLKSKYSDYKINRTFKITSIDRKEGSIGLDINKMGRKEIEKYIIIKELEKKTKVKEIEWKTFKNLEDLRTAVKILEKDGEQFKQLYEVSRPSK